MAHEPEIRPAQPRVDETAGDVETLIDLGVMEPQPEPGPRPAPAPPQPT